VIAALRALGDLPCAGRRLAVLGDMAELGPGSEAAHREIGRCSVECGVNGLVAVGRWAGVTAAAAREAGLEWVRECEDVAGAAALVTSAAQPGDILLLKASRVVGMERLREALRLHFGNGKDG